MPEEIVKTFTNEQKYKIVKEALTTDQSISEICKKYCVSVGAFYKWQEKFMQGARDGLERKSIQVSTKEQRKIEQQAKDIARMQSVIVEITSENISLKKSIGEL